VTKDGEVLYDPGKGYLTLGAAAIIERQKGQDDKDFNLLVKTCLIIFLSEFALSSRYSYM